jgi:hypothetical protein
VRKKFSSILKSYGLGGNWQAEGAGADQADLSKTIFKDKASGTGISVLDPRQFGVDPDPRIHSSD